MITEVELLANNPDKKSYLENQGIEVLRSIPLVISDKSVRKYLISNVKNIFG